MCVTGGAGFIGGHLVDALLSLGARIAVIDDLSASTLEHLAGLIEMEPERVRFVHGSVLDDEALADVLHGAQTVFHLAAIGSVPRSVAEPERTWAVNATGTVRVLEAARREWARRAPAGPHQRVVYAASSSAYGEDAPLPAAESAVPSPLSPYAASKLAGEHAMRAWSRTFGMSTVSLRYFNVFGPRQPAEAAYAAVVPAFIRRLLAGQPPVIYGDGQQTRDLTPVPNAVVATLLAGASETPLAGEVFNVGLGQRVRVLDLASMLAARCGVPHLRPVFQPARPGEVRHSQADISRTRDVLGYEPVQGLDAGLDETVEWHRHVLAGSTPA